MKTFTSSSLFLGAALAACTSPAWALGSSDSDSQLFVTLKTGVQYNDNLFLSSPRESETLFSAAPGVQFVFGQTAMVTGQGYYFEEFQFYSNNSDLNTSLSNVGFSAKYDDSKSLLTFDSSFQQANQATRDIRSLGTLVKRDIVNVTLNDELRFTEKTSLSAGIDYDDTNYKRAGYTDYETISVPVKYYYRVAPKLDVSGGYRYRDSHLGRGGIDSKEGFYNVGFRGEVTPKLTGELAVGYTRLKPDVGNATSGLGLEASFDYAYSQKTIVTFGANQNYSYSATGDNTRIGGLNAGVSAAVAEDLRLNAAISYSRYAYLGSNRRDNFYTGQLGATYTVNENVSITGAYAYSKNSSNLAGATFTDNIVSVFANLRF